MIFPSWDSEKVQKVQYFVRYPTNVRKSLKFRVYSAIGWNDRTKLDLASEDFLSSRLNIEIEIQSSENLKDISYLYKRICCIIDYVRMLFINMDTVAMVQ